MPIYDMKCEDCGLIEEVTMSFEESELGLACPDRRCGGHMVRQMSTRVSVTGCNHFIRKKGLDAKQDRYYANKHLEQIGKLPKGIKPEKGVVNEL